MAFRTFENKPGVEFDAEKTSVIFADDLNEIQSRIEDLEENPAGGVKCTGAEINTGTDDAKFATPKAIADSDIAFLSDIPSVPVKCTGAEINTGTDDAKFATSKAIADSDIIRGGVVGQVNGFTGKTTPVTADLIFMEDSAASYAKKKVTFGNFKTALSIPTVPSKCTGAEINTGTNDTKFATPKAIADSNVAFTSDIPSKCTGAEINTGTDDAKFATPKAIADSDIAFLSDIPSVPVKCTGAEINTGTNDTKFATPKAIADSNVAFLSDCQKAYFYVASSNVIASANTERVSASSSYVKIKQFTVNHSGTVHLNYDLKTSAAGNTAYIKVYVNETTYLGEITTASTTYITGEMHCTLIAGQTISVWFKDGAAANTYLRNVTISGDLTLVDNGVVNLD